MEESAPKRRRTSPHTSVEIPSASANTSPEPAAAATTTRRKRPSFASPTKASLARHNPEILERRRSASPQKSPETATRRSFLLPDEPAEDSPSEILAKRLAASVLESDAGKTDEVEPTPSQERQVRRVAGGMASGAKRTPKRPNPRPLPPPGSDDEEEDLNPFRGKTLRRSPAADVPARTSASMPPPDIPEPELPPSVPDIVSSTPPRGIHSSPSRWKEKTRHKPSSPLKKPPVQISEHLSFPTKSVKPPAVERSKERSQEVAALEALAISPRKTRVRDPDADKKKERDALLKEIEDLKKDLGVAKKENDRIRATQTAGRVLAPSDPDQVIKLLQRQSNSSESQPQLSTSKILLKAALNPIGLLPFGRPRPVASPKKREPRLDIKSHHPVQMSAEEELPYLQLFSPFSLTSTLSVLPQEQDEPLRQLHSITLRSRELPGLFTSRVEMIVNAMDLTILDLKVLALEPVAKAELGAFVEKVCNTDCNRTMQRNVGVVSWAMGEWVRVAVERAAFWSRLEKSLGSKSGVQEASQKMRARKSRRRADDDRQDDEESQEDGSALNKADLIRYLGQQAFEVSIPSDEATPGPNVRFEWKIEFDWTGEAQSKLGVLVGIPGKWHQTDDRGSLGKIPKLFAELVEGGEELETAVKTIVALVAGDVA